MPNEDPEQPKWIKGTVKITRFFLGIAVDPEYRMYQKCHITFYVAACLMNIAGCVVAILNHSSSKAKFVVVILLMFHIFTIFYFYIITMIKRDIAVSITEHYTPSDPKYLGHTAVLLNAEFVEKDLISWTIYYIVTLGLFLAATLLFFRDGEMSDVQVDVDDFHHYVMPLWFSCGDLPDTSSWARLCWKVRDNRELLFCNMIQVVLLGYQSVYYFFALLAVICLSQASKAKAIALKKKIETIEEKLNEIVALDPRATKLTGYSRQRILKYDAESCREFKKVFKEQQRIQRFISEIMSILQEEIFVCVLSAFLFVMLGTAGVFAERNAGIYFRLRSGTIASITIYIHYKLCESVHHIYEVNEIISDALYGFSWYQQSIKFRKLFITSLILNQYTHVVKVHNSYVLNLSYFADNMKRLYSVLGILRLKSST